MNICLFLQVSYSLNLSVNIPNNEKYISGGNRVIEPTIVLFLLSTAFKW